MIANQLCKYLGSMWQCARGSCLCRKLHAGPQPPCLPEHNVEHVLLPPMFEHGGYHASDGEFEEQLQGESGCSTSGCAHDKEFPVRKGNDDASAHSDAMVPDGVFEQMKRSNELYEKFMVAETACTQDANNVELQAIKNRSIQGICTPTDGRLAASSDVNANEQ